MTEPLYRSELASPPVGTGRAAYADGGQTLRQLFAALRRRMQLVGWIVLAGAAAVAALTLLLTPRYTAKAQIVVEAAQNGPGDGGTTSADTGPDQATMQTQVTALSSRDLLGKVLAQLTVDPAFRAIQHRGPASIPNLSAAPDAALVIDKLERHLHVYQEAGSHVISIAYSSRDPAEAAAIANKITGYYLATGEEQSRLATNQVVSALSSEIADLRADFEAREAAVAAYQTAHGVKDAGKTNLIDVKLGDLNHELSIAQAELAARRTRYDELSASRGARGDWSRLLGGLDSQGLLDLHDQAAAVLAGRQENIVVPPRLAEDQPRGQPAQTPLHEKVRRELDQALRKLSSDERVAVAQMTAIEQRLGAVQRASDDVQLHDLVGAAAAAHHRYERLVQRRNELLEQADDVTAPARLLSWAEVSHRPSSLSPLLFIPPALVALLVIGCMVALWCDQMDQGIYTDADVASALGVRCAGFVPMSSGSIRTEGSATDNGTATASFTESLRGIVVSLQLVAQGRPGPQVILVTSSLPGEGKTALARSLAVCATHSGAKVLLVDFDERADVDAAGRAAHRDASATLDLLARDRGGNGLIPSPAGTGLDYLPIRRANGTEPSPRFSVEQMSKLLHRHRSAYDLLIIDSAAVLAKAEVRVLAAVVDQILFAVRWRTTRRDDARAALALLRGCGPNGTETRATILAAVTQVDARTMGRRLPLQLA